MGFIPISCLISILWSVGISRINGGEKIGNVEIDAKSKKAMHMIESIKLYKELALPARDAGEFLGRRAEVSWEHGEEDLIKCNERKGDGLYQMIEFYEVGVIKLKRRLHELIKTWDRPRTININWEDVGVLGSPFHRIF